MVYKHALVLIKRISPEDKKQFPTIFKSIGFSYKYTKGEKTTSSPLLNANLLWCRTAFVLIQEKKFLPLGSLLPIVFAFSGNPHKTKNDFTDLDVFGIANMKVRDDEASFTLKSATQTDVSIELTLNDLTDGQLAFIRKGKR